ncbi:MAG: hypothetical protein ACJAYX_001139 [Planctomycetota bacterium]
MNNNGDLSATKQAVDDLLLRLDPIA